MARICSSKVKVVFLFSFKAKVILGRPGGSEVNVLLGCLVGNFLELTNLRPQRLPPRAGVNLTNILHAVFELLKGAFPIIYLHPVFFGAWRGVYSASVGFKSHLSLKGVVHK